MRRIAVFVAVAAIGVCGAPSPASPDDRIARAERQTAATQADQSRRDAKTEVGPLSGKAELSHDVPVEAEKAGRWYSTPDWWVAGFTGALFAATSGLWWFTGLLWKSTQRTVNLAREEFLTAHRPRVRARNFVISRVGSDPYYGKFSLLALNEPLGGQFYLSNIGDSPAIIEGVYLTFYAAKWPLPMKRPYEGLDPNLNSFPRQIDPGESATVMFSLPIETDGIDAGKLFDPGGIYGFYALGWVEYRDRRGVIRRTAFKRLYDGERRRFIISSAADPDYESED